MGTTQRTLTDEVAEAVMGWHRGTCPNMIHDAPPGHRHEMKWEWHDAAGVAQELCEPMDDYYQPKDAWFPEGDLADAWQVLDEMVFRVGTADIRLDMEDYGRGAVTGGGPERAVRVTIGEFMAFGPAPEAICRAALWAVGHHVEKSLAS